MRATDFMTSPVVTVSPSTPISEASALLVDRGFSAVPVVDDLQQLVGIVSESDLLRGRVSADPRAHLRPIPLDVTPPPHSVEEVMTDKVVALPESADEAAFAAVMIGNKFKSVPVVSGLRVVGIVSASDLLRTHIRSDETIAREVGTRLHEYTGGRDLWSVTVTDGVVTLTGRLAEPHRRVAVLLAETVPGVARVLVADDNIAGAEPHPASAEPSEVRSEEPRDHRGLRVLSMDECLEHLRRAPVGRLAFVHDGSPVVLPVNHGLDQLDVVFRTSWGSKLQAAAQSDQVAFEIDGIDEKGKVGWSVLVRGTASIVYENSITQRLDRLGIRAWAAGEGEESFWVRVRPDEITGRAIAPRQ